MTEHPPLTPTRAYAVVSADATEANPEAMYGDRERAEGVVTRLTHPERFRVVEVEIREVSRG